MHYVKNYAYKNFQTIEKILKVIEEQIYGE